MLPRPSLNKAICHAVNYHGLDAKLNLPDWQIADLIEPEVKKHLQGLTDVQTFERIPQRIGRTATAMTPLADLLVEDDDDDDYPLSAERLKQLLRDRDDFIVKCGLWSDYVDSIPFRAKKESIL